MNAKGGKKSGAYWNGAHVTWISNVLVDCGRSQFAARAPHSHTEPTIQVNISGVGFCLMVKVEFDGELGGLDERLFNLLAVERLSGGRAGV